MFNSKVKLAYKQVQIVKELRASGASVLERYDLLVQYMKMYRIEQVEHMTPEFNQFLLDLTVAAAEARKTQLDELTALNADLCEEVGQLQDLNNTQAETITFLQNKLTPQVERAQAEALRYEAEQVSYQEPRKYDPTLN